MSASNEWAEWHLTFSGWIKGSSRIDFSGVVKIDEPENRVLTMKYFEKMSSGFSNLNSGVDKLWSSNDEEEIKKLLNEYGECPKEL